MIAAVRELTGTTAARPGTGYRPDIDGLRAIAVIAVVLFHVGVPAFDGGFIGVDIFLVISGYLITANLLRDHDRGSLTLASFAVRRVKRLAPVLFLTVLATLLTAAAIAIPNGGIAALAKSAFASSGFVSNVYFWRNASDYFADSSDRWALLHTWSLALEAQFYVVWPFVVIGALRLTRSTSSVVRSIGAAALPAALLVSLLVAELLVARAPGAAFYLLPGRLVEFAVGAVVATPGFRSWSGAQWIRRHGAPVSLAAMVTLCGGVALYGSVDRFPGVTALPIVLATAALIAAGSPDRLGLMDRLLSGSVLVIVGRVSYSWYLLHWPALTLARNVWLDTDLVRDTIVAAVTLIAAVAVHLVVEVPAMRRSWRSNTGIGVATATVALVVALSTQLIRDEASLSLLDIDAAETAALSDRVEARSRCTPEPDSVVGCELGERGAPTVVVIGDSHAEPLYQPVVRALEDTGLRVELVWSPACPFNLGFVPDDAVTTMADGCGSLNAARAQYLFERRSDIVGVVATSRSIGYLRDADGTVAPGAADRWAATLGRTYAELAEVGIPVIHLLDNPTFEFDVPVCLIRGRGDCDRDRADAERFRHAATAAELAAIEPLPSVQVVDVFDILCSESVCSARDDHGVLYRDTNHLSAAGGDALTSVLRSTLTELTR